MNSRWVDVGGVEAVSETAPFSAEVDGTHDGEILGEALVQDCQIICPRHGAHFCLRTGEALTPPAYEPLRTYRVREQDGRILVELAP
jgi:3-phenylpropionate/trans-cinnamate dioxygenase ferredoxin subunit